MSKSTSPGNRRPERIPCKKCAASGLNKEVLRARKCSCCKGLGYITESDEEFLCDQCDGLGQQQVSPPCDLCEGKGFKVHIVEDRLVPCPECEGFKRMWLDDTRDECPKCSDGSTGSCTDCNEIGARLYFKCDMCGGTGVLGSTNESCGSCKKGFTPIENHFLPRMRIWRPFSLMPADLGFWKPYWEEIGATECQQCSNAKNALETIDCSICKGIGVTAKTGEEERFDELISWVEGLPAPVFIKKCKSCNGEGFYSCETCNGESMIVVSEAHWSKCPVCDGDGTAVEKVVLR